MKVLRILKSARRLLFLNKLRLFLSLSGIAAGIMSVIVITALGEGARGKMLSQIESMGSNLITIDAGIIKEVIGRKREASKVVTLKEKDADALKENCSYVTLIAPTQEQTLLIKYNDGVANMRVVGTTPDYLSIKNYKLQSGRFFNDNENKVSLRVAVVGQKIIQYLFQGISPVGETIRINKIPFEVIGVLQPKGVSYDGANEDDLIFIPLNTGMRRVFSRMSENLTVDYIKNIYVSVNDKNKMGQAEEEIRNILRERHRLNIQNKEDDFTIKNSYTALKAESETDDTFTIFISGIGVLSLLIGGVGIFAIMLLSVKERKPEIGLRIAVGAKAKDILFQFLSEAVAVSFAGGIAGIFAGTALVYLITIFTELSPRFSVPAVLISFLISIFIGIVSGIYPAKRASSVEPVKALNN